MELFDIVMKLVGPVQPVGESNADRQRLENMKALTELTDRLLFEISLAEPSANRVEASMKVIGCYARDFMNGIRDAD